MRDALQVWNPFQEFKELDRFLSDSFRNQRGENGLKIADVFPAAADVEETEKEYHLSFDLPGFKKEDIKIEYIDGLLKVSGERKYEKKEGAGKRKVYERSYGSFERAFRLGNEIDSEKIHAQYTDGVLKLSVPKSEAIKPRQISIR